MDMEANDPSGAEKKRLKTIQESSTADLEVALPSDVIAEILSRLPVRSILRFKSVCKSWYALFSDPSFVEKHMKASMEDKDYAKHRLIINSFLSMEVKSCSIPSILHEDNCTAYPLDYPGKSTDADEVLIVGSVHGLVFIDVDKVGLFLWNPATRESKRLPRNGFENRSDYQLTAYGFGYDESSSDYKVMFIKTDIMTYRGRPFECKAKIYSLKANSWSKIENLPDCNMLSDSGKFVSGAFHWTTCFGTRLNNNRSILTFNLSDDTFSEISQPCFGECFMESIGVLDGCLCLLLNFGGTKVDIWVMKEYGKIESWSKLFSISFENVLHNFHYSTPLFISRKNEMLLMIGFNLVLYNAEDNTVSRPVIQNIDGHPVIQNNDGDGVPKVDTYIETLVSPLS